LASQLVAVNLPELGSIQRLKHMADQIRAFERRPFGLGGSGVSPSKVNNAALLIWFN
jgi:hypothetical protein